MNKGLEQVFKAHFIQGLNKMKEQGWDYSTAKGNEGKWFKNAESPVRYYTNEELYFELFKRKV